MKKSELVDAGAQVHQQTVEFRLYQHPKTKVFYWVIGEEFWKAADGWKLGNERLRFEK